MKLTPEVMEQEAQAVAKDVVALIVAGMDPEKSMAEKASQIAMAGYGTFGNIQAGLDDDANRARFGANVLAKAMDMFVDELLPLTEENGEED